MTSHKNTGIRIEAVREINDSGEMGYRITKIQALVNKDLPKMYRGNERPVAVLGTGWIDPENRLFLYDWEQPVCIQGWDYIWPTFYICEDMKAILGHIKAAGQHLADVNAHLRKERDTWNGKVTFVDGVEQEQEKDILSKKHSAEQLYKITDGSWNLCSTKTDPIMKHFPGLVRCVDNKYRIIDQGCDLLAYSPAHLRAPKRNDTIIQNIDTGQIVFTCKRFLRQA